MKAANGIPWWYFYQTGDQLEGHHLESVDRGGRQWKAIGPERAIGCVVDPACEVVSPGLIVHHEFKRFTIGEPDGSRSTRVQTLARTLTTAGFDAPVRDNVRWNVWLKLWETPALTRLACSPSRPLIASLVSPGSEACASR